MGGIALIGDYHPTVPAHQAIPLALERAGQETGTAIEWTWIETASIGMDVAARLAYDTRGGAIRGAPGRPGG